MGFKRMDQGHQQPRTGGTYRMAQRTGTAMDIDLAVIKFQITDGGHRHHGKGFVDFPKIDIVLGPARLGQHLLD